VRCYLDSVPYNKVFTSIHSHLLVGAILIHTGCNNGIKLTQYYNIPTNTKHSRKITLIDNKNNNTGIGTLNAQELRQQKTLNLRLIQY
jgi:preprotein translocase subunit SecF